MSLFFRIPSVDIITRPQQFRVAYGSDIFVSYAEVRSWGYVDQARGRVVIIELNNYDYEEGSSQIFVAKDGAWVDQLLFQASDISGADPRIAAGGLIASYSTPIDGPIPAAPGQWVEFTDAGFQPYTAISNQNVDFSIPGRITINWQTVVPQTDIWFQAYLTANIKAKSANQEYGVAIGVNGLFEPNSVIRLIRESSSDTEEVMLHGHRPVPNGSSISVFFTNFTSANPPEIQSVNLRIFGRAA